MGTITPILLTALKISVTLLFIAIVMKVTEVEFNRPSLAIALGLSIFLGYFLFWLVKLLVIVFVISLLMKLMIMRRRPSKARFVPPELEEARELQHEREK